MADSIIFKYRLYPRHDKDIIACLEEYELSLETAMYIALKSYLDGKCYVFKLSKRNEPLEIKGAKQKILKLSKTNDKMLIAFLSNIKTGYRTSIMKNIIRFYLASPVSQTILNSKFSLNNDIFRAGPELELPQIKKAEDRYAYYTNLKQGVQNEN